MPIEKPTKPYGIYYWDTFEKPGEDTWMMAEADTLQDAIDWVETNPDFRLSAKGADRIDIVEYPKGDVVKQYKVG